MGIDSHLSTCVGTQSPKYLEMAQRHISLSRLGRLGPKKGGRARGWAAAGPTREGGEGGAAGPPAGPAEGGREEEGKKEKAFLFLISVFSYMPNSPIHSTTSKRVHNPA
jgi:hypothetical protein